MNSTAISIKIANINFKIKIMLDCYLQSSLYIGQMMSIVQINGFILVACSKQETDTAEITYSKYIAGDDIELKEYIKDPIKYCRGLLAPTKPNNMMLMAKIALDKKIINPYPHLFAIAVVNSLETSQKQALIDAEMMCKCITAEPQYLALCVFIANIFHKLIMVENSAIFLLEIMNESAKIACEYLPADIRNEFKKILDFSCQISNNENELLDKFTDSVNKSHYKTIYLIGWIIKKMHIWINLHNKTESLKLLLKFHTDLKLDIEDLFEEVNMRNKESTEYLVFILPLLEALSGVIVASYCMIQDKMQIKHLQQICLGYFSPINEKNNPEQIKKIYQTALSWAEALLFE